MKKLIIGLVLGMMIGTSTVSFAAVEDLVGTEVKAVFAQFSLKINGADKTLETAPLVYNGTSYLPVRDIANLVGYDVTYKADTRTIELDSVTGNTYTPAQPIKQDPPVKEPEMTKQNPSTEIDVYARLKVDRTQWIAVHDLKSRFGIYLGSSGGIGDEMRFFNSSKVLVLSFKDTMTRNSEATIDGVRLIKQETHLFLSLPDLASEGIIPAQ